MKLDINKELFGFQPYEFSSFLTGHSLIKGYKYKGQLICNLLMYEEEGHYYNYEDENVNFYSPLEINENGTFFFKIKKKVFLAENDNFYFYTNFQTNLESLDIIMINAVSKNNKNSYYWTYCTIDYLIQTTKKRSEDIYIEYYPTEIAFVLNRFLLQKKIIKSDVIDKIQSLKTEEDIISGFYK